MNPKGEAHLKHLERSKQARIRSQQKLLKAFEDKPELLNAVFNLVDAGPEPTHNPILRSRMENKRANENIMIKHKSWYDKKLKKGHTKKR